MSDDRTWIHTETVYAGDTEDDGWPKRNLSASINPLLDWVEIRSSLRHEGIIQRIPKAEFAKWLQDCQDTLARQSSPSDSSSGNGK